MGKEEDALSELLKSFDRNTSPISEAHISDAIAKLRKDLGIENFPFEFSAELMAFCANERNILYGEFRKGKQFEIRSLDKMTSKHIEYWKQRLVTVKNPVLKSRYAFLIWDQTKEVTGENADYRFAQIAIDSTIEIAQTLRHSFTSQVIEKLQNALCLALSLNDRSRIENVKECILAYEDKTAQDDKIGTWGFSFDIFWNVNNVALTAPQWAKIIASLENHMQNCAGLVDTSKRNPFAVESASRRLALYYKKEMRIEDLKRVLKTSADAFISAGEDASSLLRHAWFQRVYSSYIEFGLNSDAEEITKKIREVGSGLLQELKQFTTKIEIPKDKLESSIEILTKGNIHDSLSRIALYFIPTKLMVENGLRRLSEMAPLSFMFTTSIIDHEGRVVSTVGPLEDDLNGNLIKQISDEISMMGLFLNLSIKKVRQKYGESVDDYLNHLYCSPIFPENSKSVISSGLKEYFGGNYVYAIHLLIPQVECIFRNLLQMAGGSILNQSKSAGWDYKLLHEILNEPILTNIFGDDGDDVIRYFKTVLTDQRGWNLRNSICHGFADLNSISVHHLDRVFHILLCLANIKQSGKP